MEKIIFLKAALECVNDALNQMRNLVDEIEGDIRQKDLKNVTKDFEKEVIYILQDTNSNKLNDHKVDEKILHLQQEIDSLKRIKQLKFKAKNFYDISLMSDVEDLAFHSSEDEEDWDNTPLEEKYKSKSKVLLSYSPIFSDSSNSKNSLNNESSRSSSDYSNSTVCHSSSHEWWKTVEMDASEVSMKENIDWEREKLAQEELKICLVIYPFNKNELTTCEDLEKLVRNYTKDEIQWTMHRKRYRSTDSAALIIIKFNSMEDRQKLLDIRREMGRGPLVIGESLTYIQRRERYKMNAMGSYLREKGHHVTFKRRKMLVDGKWWTYCFGKGWRQILLQDLDLY